MAYMGPLNGDMPAIEGPSKESEGLHGVRLKGYQAKDYVGSCKRPLQGVMRTI